MTQAASGGRWMTHVSPPGMVYSKRGVFSFSPPVKEASRMQNLRQFLLTPEVDGSGKGEGRAVAIGHSSVGRDVQEAVRAFAAFLLCKSCKLTPLQLFIRVCSSSETLLLKQAFICYFFERAQKLAGNHRPASPRTKSKRSGRTEAGSCQALH